MNEELSRIDMELTEALVKLKDAIGQASVKKLTDEVDSVLYFVNGWSLTENKVLSGVGFTSLLRH